MSRSVVAAVLMITVFPLAGCPSCNPVCMSDDCRGPDGPLGFVGGDGGSSAGSDAGPNPTDRFTSVEIEPSMPVLQTTAGAATAQAFMLYGVTSNGTREAVGGEWSLDHDRLGDISNRGVVTAHGNAAGTVTVRGILRGTTGTPLVATTTLTVRITQAISVPGVAGDAADRFAAATPMDNAAERVEVLYPLDGAVMPRNVPAPDVQWERGVTGDLFRVRLTKSNLAIETFVEHTGNDFQFHWPVDADAWRLVTRSDPAEQVSISIDRLTGGELVLGNAVRVKLARGGIYGLVYYWQLEPGRILRIDAETGEREAFMPDPPEPPAGGRHCIACHAVSPSGRYLAGQLGEGTAREGTLFDLTADLTGSPAPSLYPANQVGWGPSSFNPDGTRLVVSSMPGLRILDPINGMSVNASGLPDGNANHPAWSPDGTAIAYVQSNQQWSWSFDNADLMLLPRTGDDAFGAPVKLHEADDLSTAPEGGNADLRPTWSPDSRVLAFAHGRQSTTTSESGIYLINRDGTGLARLNHASGGADGTQGFWPTFSPFVTAEDGGELYYWLAFYSRRDYGNAHVGTKGRDQRQLWVTAVRAGAPDGEDPSHVPYWLPGQITGSDNIAGYWATPACRANADECTSDADCCSGTCQPIGEDSGSCVPPSVELCRTQGQTCGGSGDCCTGLECTGNVCSPPQTCTANGLSCTAHGECCSGSCNPAGEGGSTCGAGGNGPCRMVNQSCTQDGDCCSGLLCLDGACGIIGG